MPKMLYFSEGQDFFQISPEIKYLYVRGRKRIQLLNRETKFGIGEAISANSLTGEATGVHFTGAFGQSL